MSADRVTEALAAQEAIIERGLRSFLEVGDALMVIRSDRLYLLTHTSFAEYCQDRWGFSDSRARQLVIAAKTVSTLTASGLPTPANERQASELAKVPESEREQVWRETLDRTGGKPTATAVREVAANTQAGQSDLTSQLLNPDVDQREVDRQLAVKARASATPPVTDPKPATSEPAPKPRPSKRDKAVERIESAVRIYRECAPSVSRENPDAAAVVAIAAIETCTRDVDDATCGAIARAVIAEHRARRAT